MARQFGAMRTLPSGRVQASYMVDGVRYPAPATFTDDARRPGGLKPQSARDKAEAWLRGVRADIERGTWVSPTVEAERQAEDAKRAVAERFGTYADTWLAQRTNSKGQPLRPKTRNEYARLLRGSLALFTEDRLTAITPARVRSWHAERAASAPTAAGAEARLLRAIMNTALVDGIVTTNPVPSVLTRSRTGISHRPPTLDELGVILDTIDDRFRLAVLLAAYGGLRLSEWRALRRQDLTVSGGRVLVSVTRTAQYIADEGWHVGPPKSDEGKREVPLPAAATADVERHLSAHVGPFPESLLFAPARDAEFLHDRQFLTAWNPARDAAGVRVPVRWDAKGRPVAWDAVVREHDLRAFAGTVHAQSGATLRDTMAFLGHSTTVAAMAYQHSAAERLHELADRMPMPARGSKPKVLPLPGATTA